VQSLQWRQVTPGVEARLPVRHHCIDPFLRQRHKPGSTRLGNNPVALSDRQDCNLKSLKLKCILLKCGGHKFSISMVDSESGR
jgi:hypothetical protein